MAATEESNPEKQSFNTVLYHHDTLINALMHHHTAPILYIKYRGRYPGRAEGPVPGDLRAAPPPPARPPAPAPPPLLPPHAAEPHAPPRGPPHLASAPRPPSTAPCSGSRKARTGVWRPRQRRACRSFPPPAPSPGRPPRGGPARPRPAPRRAAPHPADAGAGAACRRFAQPFAPAARALRSIVCRCGTAARGAGSQPRTALRRILLGPK